jgi:hypothetical protein
MTSNTHVMLQTQAAPGQSVDVPSPPPKPRQNDRIKELADSPAPPAHRSHDKVISVASASDPAEVELRSLTTIVMTTVLLPGRQHPKL